MFLRQNESINNHTEGRMFIATLFLVLLAVPVVRSADYKAPPPTFEAKDFTKWDNIKRSGKSRRADIHVDYKAEDGSDDFVHLYRLDLVGNAYDRGYAQGYLMAKGMPSSISFV
jgi:hypothetical protein